jgi:hypothetical protein
VVGLKALRSVRPSWFRGMCRSWEKARDTGSSTPQRSTTITDNTFLFIIHIIGKTKIKTKLKIIKGFLIKVIVGYKINFPCPAKPVAG